MPVQPDPVAPRPVLVVDFGAQYAQLIARRVREARVFSEVIAHTATVEEIKAKNPRAIVLSGGPASVYADGAPQLDPAVFDLGIPVFGICYGFQAMAQALGGTVARTGTSEYGRTEMNVLGGELHSGLPGNQPVWMSHGDAVTAAPAGFEVGAVSAAPMGSALISTISWMYIRMMGASGIRKATEMAILNANYIAQRLRPCFPVLYTGANGRVAHECILDMRHLKAQYGVSAEDVAKRLMDYGFHAPTLSFPVADTLMIEPTESESQAELDRFCDAMIAIHRELQAIGRGELDRIDNPLKGAPHTALELAGEWTHPYSREQAVYPLPWVREAKFWPSVKRVDNAAGDRQLVCTCPPVSDYV